MAIRTIIQLTQTYRARRSPHTGRPILEQLNTVYGYYATVQFYDEKTFKAIQEHAIEYSGPKHEAEIRADYLRHSCG